MSSRSLVTVTLPNGDNVAQLWCWSDLHSMDWTEFFAPLAALMPNAVWTAEPIPDDMSEKEAVTGHA